jgi:hypothetical protein
MADRQFPLPVERGRNEVETRLPGPFPGSPLRANAFRQSPWTAPGRRPFALGGRPGRLKACVPYRRSPPSRITRGAPCVQRLYMTMRRAAAVCVSVRDRPTGVATGRDTPRHLPPSDTSREPRPGLESIYGGSDKRPRSGRGGVAGGGKDDDNTAPLSFEDFDAGRPSHLQEGCGRMASNARAGVRRLLCGFLTFEPPLLATAPR